MKRLLAGLLALSMLFYVAPLSAFAASDNSVSQTVTVDSQQDANLIQAIASDPFLTQTNSAPQEQNATVDTSNVSMEATNSFGKLLLNGMDEENGSTFSSKNRIVDIKMNGSTATVKYIAEEDADLVVGIYADEAEEQMVASGTVAVAKTTDGTATVAITGDIPEYYVIKGYLFDKAEHAPLCEAFRDVSQTKDIVDIGSATVEDFPEDRVINLDEDNKTNFAVVTEGVTLLTTDDVAAGQNTVAQYDNDNLNYTISNASDEIKNLQVGDILTYEYAAGEMLIVKVSTIETSGDTVTIHGDDTLEITDVFDALKIETDSNTREFEFEQEDGFEDLGEVVLDDSIFDEDTGMPTQFEGDESIEESNGPGFDLTKPFEDTKDADIGRNWKVNKTFSAGVTIGGEIAVSAQATLTYYISLGTQSVDFKVQPKAVAQLSVSGQLNETFALPSFGVAPIPGIYIGCKPEFKLNAGVNGTVVATATTTVGAKYNHTLFEKGTFENTSTTPVFKIEANIEGMVYVGIDLAPQISIFGGVVATIKVRAEMGARATVKVRAELVAGENASHGCKMCYGLTITATINLGVSLEFLCGWVDGASWDFPELSRELGRFYWSPEYNDFGKGDCPHTTPATPTTPEVPEDPIDPNIPTGGTVIDSGTCGEKGDNLTWTLDDNGVLTISGTGKMKDYDRYYTVAPWKKSEYADKIQYVLIKGGVTSIGNYAFSDCNIIVAAISKSVTNIGNSAFSGSGLTSITIPGSVTSIGTDVFSGNNALTNVVISSGILKISGNMFYNCKSLTSVTIPSSVLSIGSSAFVGCSSLTNVTIPSNVTNIGESAFYNCSSLTSVTIPNGVTQIGSSAFAYSGLTSVTIPGSVTNMGTRVFYNCDNLKTAVLQKGIQSINQATFNGCDNLTSVTIPDSVTSIGGGDSYDYGAFGRCTSLTSIAIPASVKDIGIRAFEGCTSLASVTMPEGVTSIGKSAFNGCSGLTSVTIPASVKTIGSYAFNNSDVEIHFAGTTEQWKAIALPTGTNDRVLITTIYCSDGNVEPETENSITSGKTTTDNTTLHAVFNGLTAGEDYAVIVSKSAENPLDAANLIYINQKTAGADGVLDVPFISSESGAAYVVACRKGGSTNPGGNTGKDDSGSTSKPGSDTTKPSTPEKPANSDGGGAIVAVVLIGGAAAAVTAGVILMMPVEVSGVAQLGDGNVLANANVQLMKDGQQVAQTTTDESGHFALEVKRGEYQMNVTTVNPETGEQTVRTASVKAPAKNGTFTF